MKIYKYSTNIITNFLIMKKISFILTSLAMLAGFSSCNKEKAPDFDVDNIVLDGFYVYGEATGTDKVLAENAMSAGVNEAANKALRSGMYEKYIWLLADKDFALIEKEGDKKIFYGADLKEVNYGKDGENFDNNPNMNILQGKMIIGENAPKMRVSETGMYHIVLDNNKMGDLEYPQIIVQRAKWGVRGGMNGGGFTEGTETVNNDGTVTYTWTDQEMPANGKIKFASCYGWKINLDLDGNVKAEVSFGWDNEQDKNFDIGVDIVVEEAGMYNFTLNYAPKAGKLVSSFTYSIERTGNAKTKDYSKCELELVGTAVVDGTADLSSWGWGNVYPLGKPSVPTGESKVYTWRVYDVQLSAAERAGFKVRTVNAAASGGIDSFDNGNDLTVAADGKYDIVFSADGVTGKYAFSCVPATGELIEIVANIAATGWQNPIYMWTWNNSSELTDSFQPCAPQADGTVKFAFRKDAANPTPGGCLVNGAAWGNGQTVDLDLSASKTYTVNAEQQDGKNTVK